MKTYIQRCNAIKMFKLSTSGTHDMLSA